MNKPISFSKFLALPEVVQEVLQTYDYTYAREDFNKHFQGKDKERRIAQKMKELTALLKSFDFWFNMISGDLRAWKKQNEIQIKIKKLVDLLGKDGEDLYWEYATKAGVERRKFEMNNILGGNPITENKKDMKPVSEYEVFLQMKMREWEISSLDDLETSLLKKFWNEVDSQWKGGNPEVQVNMPEEKRGLFPEMDKVQRQGSIGYGDDRKIGEKSLSAGSFCDAGNLYPEHTHPNWQPPSKQRKRGWLDK